MLLDIVFPFQIVTTLASVALGDHELISFQCHLDTLRYVEDVAFESCWSSR